MNCRTLGIAFPFAHSKIFAICGKLTHFPPTPLPIPSQALRFAAVLSWEQPVLDVPGEGIMNTTIEHE